LSRRNHNKLDSKLSSVFPDHLNCNQPKKGNTVAWGPASDDIKREIMCRLIDKIPIRV